MNKNNTFLFHNEPAKTKTSGTAQNLSVAYRNYKPDGRKGIKKLPLMYCPEK